ncbi:unnamed protein product [Strongylus vulgaris]|uniref:Ras-GEF domain-containing protein n=1 Tax=Strongylus vulgaris TaxID=40348 RepID=A0A3P7IY80_STRVU|nr:unnamed protein product [Strongylus vulgaris]
MAMVKYWGDEKHAIRLQDAVYAVYLKKVRYVPPPGYDGVPRYRAIDPDRPQLQCPCPGSDHLQWESVKERVIKAGTIEKLVECLVGADGTMDSRHFNVFFATYRAFAEPISVLDRLLRRYESLENEVNSSTSALVTQNSIRSILICWLDMYPEDFYDPDCDFSMLTNLLDFGQRSRLSDLRAKSRKLLERFKHIQEEGGMIAALPSLDQLASAFGYDASEYSRNPQERVKMFDVGSENCVQIAEQLTFWDAELFRELIIHQCQGCVWSKRHRLPNEKVYTVKATIDQFNAVSQRVMTSIVLPDCRPDFRAKIIAKWIDIARELRALKNFSSLKAVLSSLQSEPVHRLKSVWALVPSRSMAQFRDLSAIYDMDEEGDERNARRILEQVGNGFGRIVEDDWVEELDTVEGTAKSSPLRRPQLVQNCRRTKSDVNLAECQGTVPYLGSFLTDLTMIDQCTQDFTEDGLINFEKRRKEFEVLAKLRLFQSAARAYHIPMDRVFCAWFHFLPCLSEKECFNRSLEIEQPTVVSTPDLNSRHNTSQSNGNSNVLAKSNTLARLFNSSKLSEDSNANVSHSHSHSHSQSQYRFRGHYLGLRQVSNLLQRHQRQRALCPTKVEGCEFSPLDVFPHKRAYSGDSTQEVEASMSATLPECSKACHDHSRVDCCDMPSCSASVPDHIKRGLHQSDASTCSSSSYQSSGPQTDTGSFHLARVKNGDRMNELITRALEKHLIESSEDEYCLVQLLPNGVAAITFLHISPSGEFQLPDKCNPYYAVAPDPTSPMKSYTVYPLGEVAIPMTVHFRKRKDAASGDGSSPQVGPSTKKLNKMKRSNLLRWSIFASAAIDLLNTQHAQFYY